jgi:L-alanine-DL-glutamate epimerase-like enolase superfamily enzyme
MRICWLAAELGIPVSQGNTFLEFGDHTAVALPEVAWLEYSFQNLDHMVDEPVEIRDGVALAPYRPGHGLMLSATFRRSAAPLVASKDQLPPAPPNPRTAPRSMLAEAQ